MYWIAHHFRLPYSCTVNCVLVTFTYLTRTLHGSDLLICICILTLVFICTHINPGHKYNLKKVASISDCYLYHSISICVNQRDTVFQVKGKTRVNKLHSYKPKQSDAVCSLTHSSHLIIHTDKVS